MASQQIVYEDAVVTVNYSIFGKTTVDVVCRLYSAKGMSLDDFAALVYPALDAKAHLLDPAVLGADGILRAG